MLYHYVRDWTVPHGGEYTRVHAELPRFSCHDDVNGCHFLEPAQVEFHGERVQSGRD